jgi:hypothetical protein
VCALCGMLGGQAHWSESDAAPTAFAARAEAHTRQRERQTRVRLLNAVLRHYGLTVTLWAANSYLLSTRTGRTEIVDDLAHLWTTAERLSSKRCDPLDDQLLGAMGG